MTEQSGHGRSVVVFQPHLYSRTAAFAREFAQALDYADEVFVLDVYAAREQPMAGVSGATVAEHVSKPVHYVPDFSAVAELVANAVHSGDVVVTMGAGDVTMLGPEIVNALAARANRSKPQRDPKRAGMTEPEDAVEATAEPGTGGAAEPETRRRPSPRTQSRRRPSPRTATRRRRRGDAANRSDRARGTTRRQFEGPRRRASREREARREAQARAVAIEQARREAKRRAQGKSADDSKPVARGRVRGLKVAVWTVVLVTLFVGLGLLLYFTPIMAARNVVITGLGAVTQDEVTAAAAVKEGTPLLQVNTDDVAERVATIRRVASARVQREYPSTLRITVVERVPIVVKDYPDGPHLFDRDGVDFATGPPPANLPYLEADNPGPNDPPTKAALEVMTALRPEVAGQVARVSAPSVAAVTLTLVDGREVVWGTTDRTEEKAQKLAGLLTQPGHTYDVSSPDLPTVKYRWPAKSPKIPHVSVGAPAWFVLDLALPFCLRGTT